MTDGHARFAEHFSKSEFDVLAARKKMLLVFAGRAAISRFE